jgi:hypothetical protein
MSISRPRLMLVEAVTAALLLAVWLYTRSSSGNSDVPAVEILERSDSLDIARLSHDRCGIRPLQERQACYEEVLLALARRGDVRVAMGVLNRLRGLEEDVRRRGHEYAHAIGMAAYKPDRDVGRTFASCSESFQSGCYHGVIQSYFTSGSEVGAGDVAELCADFREPGASTWLRFQCVHGMGHGLTMFYGRDLPRALGGCDLLADEWDRQSCYGGAFMENVVGAAAGAHGAHAPAGHAAADAPTPFRARDSTDPYYPCSVVGARYQRSCYEMQAAIILEQGGFDYGAAARTCDGAPAAMRRHCYQSLGTNVAGATQGDHDKAIGLCALGSPEWRPWCVVGVAKNLVDVGARIDDGFEFCHRVTGEREKARCYEAMGEEISVLEHDPARREAMCAQAERRYLDACRYGARVRQDVPPELLRSGPRT